MTAIERGDPIDVDGVGRRVQRVDDRPGLRQIRAGIADPVEPQPDEAPVAVEGQLAAQLGGAAVMVANDGLEARSEEHTSELQSQSNLVCRLLLEKKKKVH